MGRGYAQLAIYALMVLAFASCGPQIKYHVREVLVPTVQDCPTPPETPSFEEISFLAIRVNPPGDPRNVAGLDEANFKLLGENILFIRGAFEACTVSKEPYEK